MSTKENVSDHLLDVVEEFVQSNSLSLDLSSQDLDNLPSVFFEGKFQSLKSICLDYNELSKLPECIGQWRDLENLSISGNNLVTLPDTIILFQNLEELCVDENDLRCLPNSIGELKLLKKLSLIGNQLNNLPDSLSELSQLRELYLDENDLKMLTFSFKELKELEKLEVSNNKLEVLSKDIGCACRLKILSLNGNQLSVLPESISQLMCVEILDISHNEIQGLPVEFPSSNVLVKLLAEGNDIKILPKWCEDMPRLEELLLSDNSLFYEPFNDTFCQNASSLKVLEAGANYVEALSENFGNLWNLEIVHFGSTLPEIERRSNSYQDGNKLRYLPDSFCELKNLIKANLNENTIQCLPENFGNLLVLTWIDLGSNMIEKLPPSFCQLRNLEYLQLSKNKLEDLPEDIGNLQKLIELRLDMNLIRRIPDSLSSIKCLQALDLFNNKLNEIPKAIFRLKKLTRLDLDRNNFDLSLDDVPKITPGINYPERDPSLKDNWRGRSRALNKDNDDVVEYAANENEEEEIEEIPWNPMALKNAINRGGAFWRSHTDSQEKRPVERPIERHSAETKIEWNPELNEKNDNSISYITDQCEEDWDEEIKANDHYISVLTMCDNRKAMGTNITNRSSFQTKVNQYPPSKQAYSVSAFYDSILDQRNHLRTNETLVDETTALEKGVISMGVIDGQFEDAE